MTAMNAKPKRTDQAKRKNAARRPLLALLVVIILLGLIPLYNDYRNSLNQPLSPQEQMNAIASMNPQELAAYYETERAKTAAYETAFALTAGTATPDIVIQDNASATAASIQRQITATPSPASQANANQLVVTCAFAIYRVDAVSATTRLQEALTQAGIAFESVQVTSDSEAYTCEGATPAPGQLNVRQHYPVIRLTDDWANQSDAQRGDSIMGIIALLDAMPLSQSTFVRIESGELVWEMELAWAQTKIEAGTRVTALWQMGYIPPASAGVAVAAAQISPTATISARAEATPTTCALRPYAIHRATEEQRLKIILNGAGIAFQSVSATASGEAKICESPQLMDIVGMVYRSTITLSVESWANATDEQRGDDIAAILAVVDNAPNNHATLLRIDSGDLSWELNLAQAKNAIKAGTRGAALWAMSVVP
jgi:hypothetical protein